MDYGQGNPAVTNKVQDMEGRTHKNKSDRPARVKEATRQSHAQTSLDETALVNIMENVRYSGKEM
jgi:hypothetical protein